MTEEDERECCYECKPVHPPTTQSTTLTTPLSTVSTSTLPPKCPQSCCLAHAGVNINSEKNGALEWTSRPGSELAEFVVSPRDNGNVVLEADFSKTIELSGFQVSSSIKSFELYYKQDVAGSVFIPYLSDITGNVYSFVTNDNAKVYFPDRDTILARWILIKNIKFASDSLQDVVFDVLGCCERCPSAPSTIAPTTSLPTGSSPTTMASSVTPPCHEGHVLPNDNCTSYVCSNGKYVLVKVCNKVCQENEQLIQLDENSCCQCVHKASTTSLPTTITISPICDNSTILCHKKCGDFSTTKCRSEYENNPSVVQNSEKYSIITTCKCPSGYKLEDTLNTENGTKRFCVQVNECDCVIDGVTHEENSVWHPKDKFGKEMWCQECECSKGSAHCSNKTCGITCSSGSILIEPSKNEEQCCYCAKVPTTHPTSTPNPMSTTPGICDGCKIVIEGSHVCKPRNSSWTEGKCETCTCTDEAQVECVTIQCQPSPTPKCDSDKMEYLKNDTTSDKCCHTLTCEICDNFTKCDGICDCPTCIDEQNCCKVRTSKIMQASVFTDFDKKNWFK